ncbi:MULTISPECIES: hypothetical protein [unclassified Pseudomonas]|uniref:hypothetical protein n=1 Tax=unclassified Pseudomonas TaxID=196821 RepID=UPI002AC9A38C|nr:MULTISPECIES: hypothetical protein [unclassified Pseudomonas]MEB0048034.1 hypothetical protein [Pseudomonas sp. Dout3]MEB0099108.1 hypothetical protein [Pseudomonas sp. DC1.2]WPX58451.1 hypothetical protein RHM68_23175 [Pseudomonas sp. DC1.2]
MSDTIFGSLLTSSPFLIDNAIPRLRPLRVVEAIPDAGGLTPLTAAARDLRILIPALPQPGPPGSRPTIRVYAELPPPAEYQVLAFLQLPAYPTGDFEVLVPRRMVGNEGEYRLTFVLDDGDNLLRATASTPLLIQKTPPFGLLTITPPRPLLPLNLATALITEAYLANNDPVMFRIPPHPEIDNQIGLRYVPYYGNTDSHMEVSYATPPVITLPDFPADRLIAVPAATIRARGNGLQQLTYRGIDRAGNRARDSLILEVRVALRITPSNISMPRVTEAIAPDNTVTLADITPDGMEVWLDSVNGLQIGDSIVPVIGNVAMPSVIYSGQPLPTRFVVTSTRVQNAVPGSANADTPAAVRFRITSGTVSVESPPRNLIFNLSTLMQLLPPVVRNLNEGTANCASPQPTSAPYADRFIEVFLPPSVLLRANVAVNLICVLSSQDDGATLINPPITISTQLSADASTLGQTLRLPYSQTMKVIGRGVMYVSYTTTNTGGQVIRSATGAIPVRGVLPGNFYCDGDPFIPTP